MALTMPLAKGDRSSSRPSWSTWSAPLQRAPRLRSSPSTATPTPNRLAAAGKDQDALTRPALVLWGDRDPYLPVKFAKAQAPS
jgi:pimeloyl-ACP methyl ester carboxylesterase